MEEILKRHRKEKKDLQNKITGMKKQANKSQRKEVNSKCELLVSDLDLRQQNEIKEFENNNNNDDDNDNNNSNDNADEITPEKLLEQLELSNKEDNNNRNQNNNSNSSNTISNQQPKKRRNRQKEKIAKREAEIEKMKEEARKEASTQPNLQKIEQASINQLCERKQLKQFDIKPDGHCLFASILDQLRLRHADPKYNDYDVYKLRSLACEYINLHKDDFIPYLFDEQTMQLIDIDDYIKEMESTAKWGGEIEIISLAKVFDCPISVLISGQATHLVNEEGSAPELKLVYYKHSYSLGEHYNSLHDDKDNIKLFN